jgi:hypothetical protein
VGVFGRGGGVIRVLAGSLGVYGTITADGADASRPTYDGGHGMFSLRVLTAALISLRFAIIPE